MKIELTAAQMDAMKAFLSEFEDCEALSDSEYVVDLYDIEPPMSIDLIVQKDGLFIEGAAELLYDDEMDGWYIGARTEDAEAVLSALRSAGALDK